MKSNGACICAEQNKLVSVFDHISRLDVSDIHQLHECNFQMNIIFVKCDFIIDSINMKFKSWHLKQFITSNYSITTQKCDGISLNTKNCSYSATPNVFPTWNFLRDTGRNDFSSPVQVREKIGIS